MMMTEVMWEMAGLLGLEFSVSYQYHILLPELLGVTESLAGFFNPQTFRTLL